jgi:hypothetical protein
MKVLGFILAIFVCVVAIYIWGVHVGIHLPKVEAAQLATSTDATTTPTIYSADGIVLMDETHGGAPTPYLLYETKGHTFVTRALKFGYARGCDFYVGDLPCASRIDQPALPVTPGESVRITGQFEDQRIFVNTVEAASTSPAGMQVERAGVGETASALGIQVRVDSVSNTHSDCVAGVGCVGGNAPVVTLYVHDAKHGREVSLAPGLLTDTPYGVVALLNVSADGKIATYVIARSTAR